MSRVAWLSKRIFCPCAKCKGVIVRLRRITIQHKEENGIWQGSSRHDSFDDDEHEDIEVEIRRNAIKSMPHYSIVRGCHKIGERVHQESLQSHRGSAQEVAYDNENDGNHEEGVNIVDKDMNKMMDNFFEEEDNEGAKTPLHKAAKKPLHDGSKYSLLQTCLELLNLQTMYGWSNTSVTSLMK